MSHTKRLLTWQLRERFAAGLSAMYAGEVPAYGTLVEVTEQVNSDYVARNPGAERLGSLRRVTAERHGAIRVGSPAELSAVAELFAAFGMLPVGYYDLRSAASPIPVVSTAFRPIDTNELARNPFRVFTSMLATRDPRYFDPDLRTRVETFVARRQLFDPALLDRARIVAAEGACDAEEAEAFVAAAVCAFALSREPINKSWYDELSRVSAVAADIAGVCSTHINHLTPRVLDIDDLYQRMSRRGITMIDAIQGPPRSDGPAVLLRQTSFRALAEPCLFRGRDGTVSSGHLRVRFGEVEARGVALTPRGRQRYDAAMASGDPARVWRDYFPSTDTEMAAQRLAYYRGGDPAAPIVYEDFLPASAAGIFRSNLDRDTRAGRGTDDSGYGVEWLAGAIGHHIHDPYALYQEASA
ncbi:2-oxoadipate dioxygenase/decarboxylase [Mycobacterium montefiorense]|uniref:2-oxoadipate dioxygenase/decarboxylase n=1 Tax=Mycobacterium montefiorense TaxID=154654 RepID=UPI0021F36437|nr:VOC family protein [Mycobacterium montefiorense]MCV7426599.1 VOC family protein [Mycobacterium montefiorense]